MKASPTKSSPASLAASVSDNRPRWGNKWSRRWFRWLGVLSIFGGVSYLVLFVGGAWQERLWLQSQRVHLEQLPPGEVNPAVRVLAEEGIAAWPELVSAMGSEQASVAIAAQKVVLEEFERLPGLPERKAAAARVLLAKSLADRVSRFGPTTIRFSAHLAERMLREDLGSLTPEQRVSLIDACGVVMRFASRQGTIHDSDRAIDANWHETPRPMSWERAIVLYGDGPREEWNEIAAEPVRPVVDALPGGGFDPEGVEVPGLPDSLAEASKSNSTAEAPRKLPDPSGENVYEPVPEPDDFRKPFRLRRLPRGYYSTDSREREKNQNQSDADASGLTPLESEARKAIPPRTDSGGGATDAPPRDETVIRLLQDLVAADEQAANRAATTLTNQGLSPAHLELAKRLADPDPQVRKSLVEILPRTSGLDARPWLLWLARDEHADVRLAAMTMLSTSQDPQLTAEVELLARGDQDERIVRLAERLSQRRR